MEKENNTNEITTKKVYKLKTWPKVLIVVLIVLSIVGYFGYQKYQEYLYTQTYEYKLLQSGYSEEDIKILLNKLNDTQLEKILSYDYNEFIPMFVNAKYFMFKNLDVYLSQVITQDEDFFKYRGTSGYDYDNIVALVNVHANNAHYTNTLKSNIELNYLLIANKYYELGSEYEPNDLVDVDIKYRYGDTKRIRSEVYDAFIEMWQDAHDAGFYLLVESGYRTYKSQLDIYNQYENQKGTKYADSIAARPGFSEHQTGLALDIYSKQCYSQSTFKDSETYKWLIENCYKYGFILRYPEGKKELTGYSYESWHYRYVGRDMAKKITESGLTFDEYYAYYIEGDN